MPFYSSMSVRAFVASTAGLRPRQKRILFIYSSVIWARQACSTGRGIEKYSVFSFQLHRLYSGGRPLAGPEQRPGPSGRSWNAVWPLPLTWTGHPVPATAPKRTSNSTKRLLLPLSAAGLCVCVCLRCRVNWKSVTWL